MVKPGWSKNIMYFKNCMREAEAGTAFHVDNEKATFVLYNVLNYSKSSTSCSILSLKARLMENVGGECKNVIFKLVEKRTSH